MQLPLQLPCLACPMLSLQPIYSTWSYTLSNVLALDPFSHSNLLFSLNSSLIFTKPRVEMMATLCSNHLPLRKYFPKIIISQIKLFLFLFQNSQNPNLLLLYFDHKTISSFVKAFQFIFSNKIGNVSGILHHLISTLKTVSLQIFSFFIWF